MGWDFLLATSQCVTTHYSINGRTNTCQFTPKSSSQVSTLHHTFCDQSTFSVPFICRPTSAFRFNISANKRSDRSNDPDKQTQSPIFRLYAGEKFVKWIIQKQKNIYTEN